MLTEILLTWGLPLTIPIERLTLAGTTVYSIAEGVRLVCLDRAVTIEVIEAMAARHPDAIVCLDSGFATDQAKANAAQTIKNHTRDGESASIDFKVL